MKECPKGFYKDTRDNYTCRKCNIKCGECFGPSEYHCKTCPEKSEVIDD